MSALHFFIAMQPLAAHFESGETILFKLCVVLVLVSLNGFFVASEFALVKVRASQLEPLIDEGNKRAELARHLATHLDAYISATQLGITMTGLALGWLGEPYVAHMIEPVLVAIGIHSEKIDAAISLVLGFSVITFLTIILGELTPKYLAIHNPVRLALFIARPLQLFFTLFKPAIWILNRTANVLLRGVFHIDPASGAELAHSEEELRAILTESQQAEEVTPLGKEILINALDLRRRVVRDITTPRGEVIFLNTEDSFEENLKVARDSRHTRF